MSPWFNLGHVAVRYYTVLFLVAIVGGYALFLWQAKRAGYSRASVNKLLIYSVFGVLTGARIGHCLLYQPEYYLAHPIEILFIWKGGLSSHGALFLMVFVLVYFAKKYEHPVLDVMDRFSFTAAFGAALIRLGNFFNSEVVGRKTDVPWGVRFMRYDFGTDLRHPVQLYEFVIGLCCLGVLWGFDVRWKKEHRPVGGLAGVFLVVYFGLRFFVEFTKEYQRDMGRSLLTMGQILSIPLVAVGAVLWIWTLYKRKMIRGR